MMWIKTIDKIKNHKIRNITAFISLITIGYDVALSIVLKTAYLLRCNDCFDTYFIGYHRINSYIAMGHVQYGAPLCM
ncbi:hypothetical protein DBV23_03465 [Edwardsiella ictaluri]|uniref:Uncharacterized protein n=2 Tax=Edwardsiella ictaluri TaxID=67780 RepID=C5BBF0_EDWI9|nr:hypothetical protein [Edwardsiella ictaluri]ACR68185.1 hypothetical protein NT01EI_0972 [Edwardsiella ictaluri 93-146]ARD40572.1 hypothetical protein B6E78_15335 [Edwardsiella ictaluri]AVZ81429.1 hypothetical protein DBV23_03465 [Edwardsiella ictaluri]EKS7764252.1 hypothetical protein [Edwardsiella ictaluri]EKS7777536.1 hypothetical protein [Edwardsiella ictaluri]